MPIKKQSLVLGGPNLPEITISLTVFKINNIFHFVISSRSDRSFLGGVVCNILLYISSINTWASGDSPLAQLVKELDLCLFLCVMRRLCVRDTAESINNFSLPTTIYIKFQDNGQNQKTDLK